MLSPTVHLLFLHFCAVVSSSDCVLGKVCEDDTNLWQKQLVATTGGRASAMTADQLRENRVLRTVPSEQWIENPSPVWYSVVGRGYCGSSEEEEVANRIGTWEYGRTKEQAQQECAASPNCQGFHWNVDCQCFALVAKIGNATCCETELGDVCYRRVAQCAHPQAQISFSMQIHGTDITTYPFNRAVQEAVVAEVGFSIKPEDVQVGISADTEVRVIVVPPFGTKSVPVLSALAASDTLPQTILDAVSKVVDAAAGISGTPPPDGYLGVPDITITDFTKPELNAVYCGDVAEAHLEDAADDAETVQ